MTHDELVEKMCEADANTLHDSFRPEPWADKTDSQKKVWRKGMAAALKVCVEEVLQELSHEEFIGSWHTMSKGPDQRVMTEPLVNQFIGSRRSRYLKPKSDPAVEAVREVLRPWTIVDSQDNQERVLREIVAAVRNADKGAN